MSGFTSKTSNSSDTASTHSTVSTATTLKGTEFPTKKWFSRGSKSTSTPETNKPGDKNAKRALHHEAIATYLSMR